MVTLFPHQPCFICGQGARDLSCDALADAFGETGVARHSRILAETQRLVALPSLGPLEEGHVIICPKAHFTSMASFAMTARAELDELVSAIGIFLSRIYARPVLLFEHGNGEATTTPSCSVEHAHLHLVPSRVQPEAFFAFLRATSDATAKDHRFMAQPETLAGREYILVATMNHNATASVGSGFNSQLLRRAYVEMSGSRQNWNWREDYQLDVVARTVETFRGFDMARATEQALGAEIMTL